MSRCGIVAILGNRGDRWAGRLLFALYGFAFPVAMQGAHVWVTGVTAAKGGLRLSGFSKGPQLEVEDLVAAGEVKRLAAARKLKPEARF